jgi:hypothetical protein
MSTEALKRSCALRAKGIVGSLQENAKSVSSGLRH